MKAVVVAAPGGPEVLRLEDQPRPEPGAGEIVVANRAIGLNFIDIYQRKGLYPVAFPAVLGTEGAGVVARVGAGVRAFREGDRAVYLSGGGAYAEETRVPAAMAANTPATMADEIAASAFLKGMTAEMLVNQVFRLEAGMTALVYAAVGGVGAILTQWAAHKGARVIAVVGDAAKERLARDYGASEVIIRTKTDAIAARVRELTEGRGVAVVYDSVGAATFEASLDSLALRGMMVSYGNASGPVPAVQPLELGRRGSLSLCRPSLFHFATPERLPGMARNLFAMIEAGAIRLAPPRVFPLAKAAEAQALLESGATTGALVLRP
jgi:NADPH2:quinone reductase